MTLNQHQINRYLDSAICFVNTYLDNPGQLDFSFKGFVAWNRNLAKTRPKI